MLFEGQEVSSSAEFQRILKLPRRSWKPEDLEKFTRELTQELKTPDGTMELRPIQALALHDLALQGGLFGPMRVGAGKTLTSLLAPYILEAKRPLLILPAGLVEKTERERQVLAKHWRISRNLKMMSYEMLGRVSGADTLTQYRPDVIIMDECHRVKNKRAGVTRRVSRYFETYPETKCVAISGTVMKNSLRDFAHLLRWCLKEGAPVPQHEGELIEWAEALDEKVNPLKRNKPGVLLKLCTLDDWRDTQDETQAARRGFQRRLVETAGVVATSQDDVTCSLEIGALKYEVSQETEKNFKTLRDKWETPDGWQFSEGIIAWACARQLALGFHYIWDPRPPEEWLNARREWAKFVRDILSRSRTLDTELQVSQACAQGKLQDNEYRQWRHLEPTFKPNMRAVWHDDSAIQTCAKWGKHAGIIWCDHTLFAQKLSKETGFPYYGANGLDQKGRYIEDNGKGTVIASRHANSTGRNLQNLWDKNLVTSPMGGAGEWEQLLGRTHRDGQLSDEVECAVLYGCWEHVDAWDKALLRAQSTLDTLGQSQKILLADKIFPEEREVKSWKGPRWDKNVIEKRILVA